MIPPQLIVFGILALIRMARAGDQALAQYARNTAVVLPGITPPAMTKALFIGSMMTDAEVARVENDPALGPLWSVFSAGDPQAKGFAEAEAALYAEALRIFAVVNGQAGFQGFDERSVTAAMTVKQWRAGTGPKDPLIGIALTVLDIGLELVAQQPSILGMRRGEKIIGAFAGNLAELIEPDKPELAHRAGFAQSAAAILLKAALTTVHEQAELFVADEDWQALVRNTLKPVVDAFPPDPKDADLLTRRRLDDFARILLGPVFIAATKTIAERPEGILGDAGKAGTLTGVLFKAVLDVAKSKDGLAAHMSPVGLAAFAQAALAALSAHPSLIVHGGDEGAKLAQEVVKNVLGTIAALDLASLPAAGDLVLQLAGAALVAVKESSGRFLGADDPWAAISGRLLTQVIDGLIAGIKEGKGDPASLVSKETLVEFGRIFLEQAAKTPAMIAGKNAELANVVKAVARAMAEDKGLLLGYADWLEIARVAAAEAAANPGRLFKLSDDAGTVLASALISAILGAAKVEAEAIRSKSKDAGNALLFGPALRELVVHTLSTAAGNLAKLAQAKSVKAVETLLAELVKHTSAEPEKYGAKELLRLYKKFLPDVLATGEVPTLTPEMLVAVLSGAGK